jgi:hypothetical protein
LRELFGVVVTWFKQRGLSGKGVCPELLFSGYGGENKQRQEQEPIRGSFAALWMTAKNRQRQGQPQHRNRNGNRKSSRKSKGNS